MEHAMEWSAKGERKTIEDFKTFAKKLKEHKRIELPPKSTQTESIGYYEERLKKERTKELKRTPEGRLGLYKQKLLEEREKKKLKKKIELPERLAKRIGKALAKRRVYHPGKKIASTYDIRPQLIPQENAYKNRFFKELYEQEKRSLFFK